MKPLASAWERPRQPIDVISQPFQRFARQAASGGILLLVFTVVALVWANSPWRESYQALWHSKLTISLASWEISSTLHHWINDGLMVVFFFVVGLEIKREVLTGELSAPRKAMLPIAAALGGMLLPALIYAGLNAGTEEVGGWGIPMATDIAFALGILALLGDAVPTALKVFLTALAIVDDLGAVLVIALFYTSKLNFVALMLGLAVFGVMVIFNRLGVRRPAPYFGAGVVLWLCFLQSGVHATIAGVLAAMVIPASVLIDKATFLERTRFLINELTQPGRPGEEVGQDEAARIVISNIEAASEYVQPPLHRLERALHPSQAFLIMPVFALANAGVEIGPEFFGILTERATWGVMLGLVFGKQFGITAFSWLTVKAGWASLPRGVTWKQIYGVGWLGGVGFTMALFIDTLAFESERQVMMGKAGILIASLVAGLVGYFLLCRWIPREG
mgnify:CR=1 FL=1